MPGIYIGLASDAPLVVVLSPVESENMDLKMGELFTKKCR